MGLSKSIIESELTLEYGLHLSQIVERLNEKDVRLIHPRTTPTSQVQAIDIYDPATENFGGEGVLLCLISAGAMRRSELETAVRRAAAHHCAGIVVKSDVTPLPKDGSITAERLAAEVGLPMLVIAPHINWREFDALITQSLGENARTLFLEPNADDKLYAVANSIARVFGGSVAIEDHQRTILAHSSVQDQVIDELRTTGILFRRAGDAPVNELRYRTVLAAEDVECFTPYRSYLPRAAIAIRAGAIPLGTIWALDPHGDGESVSEEKRHALREGAALAASILLESWSSPGRDSSERETAFKRLLSGVGNESDAETLAPTAPSAYVIAVVSVPKGERLPVRRTEIRNALSRHLSAHLDDVLVTSEGAEVIAYCPSHALESIRDKTLDALGELSRVTAVGARAGLSDPYSRLRQMTHALAEARSVLANTHDPVTVGTVSRVRPQLFIDMCREQFELDDRLVLPEIRELVEHDEVAADTLEKWFESAGNVAQIAQRLHVHEQTVRYRLRKIQTRLGNKFASPDFMLVAWAQIRTLREQRGRSPR
ncbi:MAG: PucR family transcriptional regulator [Canibacter sp.]